MTNAQIKAQTTFFDEYQGQTINKFSLTNQNNVTLSILNLGATLYEIILPDGSNLILNYAKATDYFANPFYVGMTIGRTAGRIAHGKFTIAGHQFQVPTNEKTTTLHGGPNGFNTQIFDGCINTNVEGNPEILLKHTQKSVLDGFPGNLDLQIHYTLTTDNYINIQFQAISDATTLFNPTVHTYFNLGNMSTIKKQQLQVNSTQYLELDDNKIPTGQLLDVADTPFDFRQLRPIYDSLQKLQSTPEQGLDDLFQIQPKKQPIATLSDPDTKHGVRIFSQRNGLVVFTANSFTKNNMTFKRTDGVGWPYLGIALEPQTLLNFDKDNIFEDIILPANTPTTKQISYQLLF
ncbi:aldose epimerase family protein [Bombilactobacillus thymidiniphilus]|uniref:Maltose epimerase n=1 Tax=Bombilactobacillus thymidiniphilus TaxID=2923363 RepID=A0ABY4PDH0_9LACO|nr:aldose epimerase family protein [Bombilactobacillus thymidiniphilus]UQS83665.1 galactose mutarotase [Bombilactobacillus thymidiniphilus]